MQIDSFIILYLLDIFSVLGYFFADARSSRYISPSISKSQIRIPVARN